MSLSTDGTIVRTLPDQRSIVLAENVAPRGWYSYAPSRGLLAYGCDPANLCMWDVHRSMKLPISEHAGEIQPSGIAFSPSGARLALITTAGALRVFDVTVPVGLTERSHMDTEQGIAVLFVDEDTIAVAGRETLQIVRNNSLSRPLVIGEPYFWDASADGRSMVLGTIRGQGNLVDLAHMNITKRITLCHSSVSAAKFIPQQAAVAYSCKEGTIGTWNLQTNETAPLVHLEGHADGLRGTLFPLL